ncbi:MAG: hypothetical protein K8T90_16895 [Planctomycetes bacterium]|nr:hypothetical protein [Planctomycetota bacterium]
MYLTAHRLRSVRLEEGINAFLYLHRDRPLPMRGPDEPDVDTIAQSEPGYPVAESIDVPPGGNSVLAYLDLAAPDDATESALRGAVAELRRRLPDERLPMLAVHGGSATRFGANLEFEGRIDESIALLDGLEAAALALLPQRNAAPAKVSGPYVVHGRPGSDGLRLFLPPATLQRLPAGPMRRSSIVVPSEVIRAAPFDAVADAARALLGVSEADLVREQGFEVVEPASDRLLLRWAPPR